MSVEAVASKVKRKASGHLEQWHAVPKTMKVVPMSLGLPAEERSVLSKWSDLKAELEVAVVEEAEPRS